MSILLATKPKTATALGMLWVIYALFSVFQKPSANRQACSKIDIEKFQMHAYSYRVIKKGRNIKGLESKCGFFRLLHISLWQACLKCTQQCQNWTANPRLKYHYFDLISVLLYKSDSGSNHHSIVLSLEAQSEPWTTKPSWTHYLQVNVHCLLRSVFQNVYQAKYSALNLM